MYRLISHIYIFSLTSIAAFLVLSAASVKFNAVNWLFFQPKDDFNTDSHTIIGIEHALSDSVTGGLLIVGSSVCKNSINPRLLSELIQTPVHQFCTGGQSVQGALAIADFLNARLKPDAIVLDLYPRVAEEQIVEGCMRIMLGHPDGRTALARFNAWSIADDWPLRYLWARSWVSSFFSASKERGQKQQIPGFLCAENKPAMPRVIERNSVEIDPIALNAMREWTSEHPEVRFIVNLPPLHGGQFEPLDGEPYIGLAPKFMDDSCFFDSHHMRCECSDQYTTELAQSLEPLLD